MKRLHSPTHRLFPVWSKTDEKSYVTGHLRFGQVQDEDSSAIDARYRSGILFVTLPIEEEDAPYGEEIEVTD